MKLYWQTSTGPPQFEPSVIHVGHIVDPWPAAVREFFEKLKPSESPVPLADISQVLAEATGHRLGHGAIRELARLRRFKIRKGAVYAE